LAVVDTVIGSVSLNMWHGWGVLAGLIAIAILVWEGLRLANLKVEIGLTPAMVTAALAILLVLATILKFLVDNEARTFWAWLGLLLAIAVAVGAWLNMKMLGESIADMGSSMKEAASSAAAAAQGATQKDDATAAPAAAPPAAGSGRARGSCGARPGGRGSACCCGGRGGRDRGGRRRASDNPARLNDDGGRPRIPGRPPR
jgi:hypothetical protein